MGYIHYEYVFWTSVASSFFFFFDEKYVYFIRKRINHLEKQKFNTWWSFLNPSNKIINSFGVMSQSVCQPIPKSLNMLYLCPSKSLQAMINTLYDVVNAGWCRGYII